VGTAVRTRIIEPEARTLELPLLVRSGSFFFLFCLKLGLRGSVFAVRSPPLSKTGNFGGLRPCSVAMGPFRTLPL